MMNYITGIYAYLVFIFYFALLSPFAFGILFKYDGPEISYSLKVLFQLIFLFPLFFYFFSLKRINGFNIKIFLYFILFLFLFNFNSIKGFIDFLQGVKVYLVPIVFLAFTSFLAQNDKYFLNRFTKHINIAFFLIFLISAFELLSIKIMHNPLHEWIKTISPIIRSEFYGRPNGIFLDSHSAPFVLGMATIYFFIIKRPILMIFCLSIVLTSNVKGWIFSLNITLLLYILYNLYNKKYDVLKSFAIFIIGTVVILYLDKGLVENAKYHVESVVNEDKTSSMGTMIDLYSNINNYFSISILPNGFSFASTYLSDAYILDIGMQLGLLGLIMYLFFIYNQFSLKDNKYWPIIFYSFSAFIHTNPLNNISIMIILSYFLNKKHESSKI